MTAKVNAPKTVATQLLIDEEGWVANWIAFWVIIDDNFQSQDPGEAIQRGTH